jgi:hypothetical protein
MVVKENKGHHQVISTSHFLAHSKFLDLSFSLP